MKKLATTFGLLALMLVVTSFTTPEVGGGKSGGKGQGTSTGGELIPTYQIGGDKSGTKGQGTSTGGELTSTFEVGGKQGPKGQGTSTGGE